MALASLPRHAALLLVGVCVLIIGCTRDVAGPSGSPAILLAIVSGGQQFGTVGTELALPLVIKATNNKGQPVPNVVVNFRVTKGGGSIYAGSATTDGKGIAADYWTLGTSTAQAQEVEARAVMATGEKQVYGIFTATPLPGTGVAMAAVNGRDSQWKLAGTAVLIQPSVKVTDQYGNPVSGVVVTIAPTSGGGSVTGGDAITNTQGIATVGSWTLGPVAGTNTLAATSAGLSGSPVVFRAVGNVGALYVSNQNGNSVTVYAAGTTGNVSPLFTIEGASTGLNVPTGIAIDGSGNLHVLNAGTKTITTFALGATGNATPIRKISGSNTGLTSPTGMATDLAGNLYVTNQTDDNIRVFSAGSNGDAPPIRTIVGSNTGLSRPMGITFDAADNLYVINLGTYGSSCCNGSVTVYPSVANGNATPTRTIGGSNGGMFNSLGIAVDPSGAVYVSNFGNTNQGPSNPGTGIVSFAPGASGNVAPARAIEGFGRLSQPLGLAIDAINQVFVANSAANSVSVYPSGATGNVAPITTISGGNTGLNAPAYITF